MRRTALIVIYNHTGSRILSTVMSVGNQVVFRTYPSSPRKTTAEFLLPSLRKRNLINKREHCY